MSLLLKPGSQAVWLSGCSLLNHIVAASLLQKKKLQERMQLHTKDKAVDP